MLVGEGVQMAIMARCFFFLLVSHGGANVFPVCVRAGTNPAPSDCGAGQSHAAVCHRQEEKYCGSRMCESGGWSRRALVAIGAPRLRWGYPDKTGWGGRKRQLQRIGDG